MQSKLHDPVKIFLDQTPCETHYDFIAYVIAQRVGKEIFNLLFWTIISEGVIKLYFNENQITYHAK